MDIIPTILLGIASNVLTPYIIKISSNLLSKVSTQWAIRTEKHKQHFQNKVITISSDKHQEIMLGVKVLQDFSYGLLFIALGFIVIALSIFAKHPDKINLIFGLIFVMYGIYYFTPNQDVNILREVKKNRR